MGPFGEIIGSAKTHSSLNMSGSNASIRLDDEEEKFSKANNSIYKSRSDFLSNPPSQDVISKAHNDKLQESESSDHS